MSSESMVTCASGLLPHPAKVPFFQYRAWWYSIVQKFHNDVKKIQESQFWAYFRLRPWSGLSPKISKLGMMVFYRLKISLKIIFYFFSCPVTDQQPKNVLPISVATWNFLFIWNCSCKTLVTFLHAKICDLSETSEILNRSCKLLVRVVQRVTITYCKNLTQLWYLQPNSVFKKRNTKKSTFAQDL
jgi:hypothetical protein